MSAVGGTANVRLLYWPDRSNSKRRPPWNWATLNDEDRLAQTDLVTEWTRHYNSVYAVKEDELIPPCWPQHPWLATELAVMVWLWWHAHCDPTSNILQAGEYYLRYLPGFRDRLTSTLGKSPVECRQGSHPDSWRNDAIRATNQWSRPAEEFHSRDQIRNVAGYDFGF